MMGTFKSFNNNLISCSLLLIITSTVQAITLHLNGETIYFNTPYSRYGLIRLSYTGAGLTVADPPDLCSPQQADFTNKIVLATQNGCTPANKIQRAQERGAVAIVVQDAQNPGLAGRSYWKTATGQWAPANSLPFLTVNTSNGDALIALVKNLTATDVLTADLDPYEYNAWVEVLDTSNAYTGVVIALVLGNGAGLGFAMSRFVSLIMAKGFKRTTAHLALSLIIGMHTATIIHYVCNIIDIKVGPIAPDLFYTVFLILPELLQMTSSLIVSLYWFELINSVTSQPITFLNKLFKPFIAFAIIISVLYIAVIIMAGLYISDLVLLLFLLVFLILSVAVGIIWIIVGIKLIRQIRTNAQLREKSKKASSFNRLSILVILCGIFLFLTRGLYIVLGVDSTILESPWKWLPVVTMIFGFQLVVAFIQTGLFKLHKRDFKTSSGALEQNDKSRKSRHSAVTEIENKTPRIVDASKTLGEQPSSVEENELVNITNKVKHESRAESCPVHKDSEDVSSSSSE